MVSARAAAVLVCQTQRGLSDERCPRDSVCCCTLINQVNLQIDIEFAFHICESLRTGIMAAALLASPIAAAMHSSCRGQVSRSAPQPTLAQLPAPSPFRQRTAEVGALHSKPFLSGALPCCIDSDLRTATALPACAPRNRALHWSSWSCRQCRRSSLSKLFVRVAVQRLAAPVSRNCCPGWTPKLMSTQCCAQAPPSSVSTSGRPLAPWQPCARAVH